MLPPVWPEELRKIAPDLCGIIVAVEPLAGLSGAAVWRLVGQGGWAVVKRCTQREASLYRLADTLNAAGVTLPALLWTGASVDGAWIVIEYLPAVPPRAAWLANPGWMQVLARLHRLPPAALAGVHEPFRPRWIATMTDAALELVAADQRRPLRAQFAAIAQATQQLQQAVQLISGDPNPRNWGLRNDGAAVLFDWERVGFGPAAFDLAMALRADAKRHHHPWPGQLLRRRARGACVPGGDGADNAARYRCGVTGARHHALQGLGGGGVYGDGSDGAAGA